VRNLILTFVAAVVVASPPAVADTGPLVTVKQFITNFNQGNEKAALALCATPASVIDEFPPHQWQGPTACADWVRDLDAFDKRAGITDGIVVLGKTWQVDVTGDRAYVVAPATYRYKQRGAVRMETGSIFTVVLRRSTPGWRITGWAWAKH